MPPKEKKFTMNKVEKNNPKVSKEEEAACSNSVKKEKEEGEQG